MMFWFPARSEMFLSSLPKEEIFRRLELAVKSVDYQYYQNRALGKEEGVAYLFNGKVGNAGFAISKIVERPNNFLPLIRGRVEGNEKGSLVHLQFKIFPSVTFFMAFWAILMLLLSLISFLEGENWLNITFPLLILAASYWLILSRFEAAYQKSRKELIRLIS